MANIGDILKNKHDEGYMKKLNVSDTKTHSETIRGNTQKEGKQLGNDYKKNSSRGNNTSLNGNQNYVYKFDKTHNHHSANTNKTVDTSEYSNRTHNRGSKHENSLKDSTYANNIKEFGDKFVNPYNFIRLGERVSRDKTTNYSNNSSLSELLTGSINCTLMTKTPIFIPNISNDNAFGFAERINVKKKEEKTDGYGSKEKNEKHKNYDFFSYNDLSGENTTNDPKEPVIPGSSIRGAIRSAFEALTDSCMMTSDMPLTVREGKSKKAGILVKNKTGWKLYKAEKYMIKTNECNLDPESIYDIEKDSKGKFIKIGEKKYYTGDKILFDCGKFYKEKKYFPIMAKSIGYGSKEGILLLGEPFGTKKHHDSIFKYIKFNKETIEVQGNIDKSVEKLKLVMEIYNDPAVNRNLGNQISDHNGYKHYDLFNIKDGGEYPVWYEEVDGTIYLAPACISRITLNNTITKILEKNGEYNACSDVSNLCEACKLFGMVGDNSSLGSKIRFTDAKFIGDFIKEKCYTNLMVLDELSSPKPSAVEFYTERPKVQSGENAHFWNYDYSTNITKSNKEGLISYENDKLKILGRKYYWHSHSIRAQEVTNPNDLSNLDISVLNTTARPVNKNMKFIFDVYFEKITNEELEKLLWILTIGENKIGAGKEHFEQFHKIGGAKSIGFGSVKITVNNVKSRTWRIANDGSIIRVNEPMNLEYLLDKNLFKEETCKEFLKITNFEITKDKNVRYPFGEIIDNTRKSNNDEGGHVWFKLNRIAGNEATEIKKNIEFSLKGILEDTELSQLNQDKTKKYNSPKKI